MSETLPTELKMLDLSEASGATCGPTGCGCGAGANADSQKQEVELLPRQNA